ncbi:MAG TPA: hypothetical protein VG253_08325 [Streptosporangiaceae bacterium]|nr:hypothetical protein [Streptosporangiaceae bacterium]
MGARGDGAGREEAAWRDLIAQYRTDVPAGEGERPWPEREDLPPRTRGGPGDDTGPDTDPALGAGLGGGPSLDLSDPPGAAGAPPDVAPPDAAAPPDAGPATPGLGPRWTGYAPKGPARSGSGGSPGSDASGHGSNGRGASGHENGDEGPDTARVVRPASPPPPPQSDDDEFIPPEPPPLPTLDPVAKGAWTGLFAGPGYLLVATVVGWQIPGWAAFCAIGAFIAGFATLVVRMGDRPPRDSGPDDGAVV